MAGCLSHCPWNEMDPFRLTSEIGAKKLWMFSDEWNKMNKQLYPNDFRCNFELFIGKLFISMETPYFWVCLSIHYFFGLFVTYYLLGLMGKLDYNSSSPTTWNFGIIWKLKNQVYFQAFQIKLIITKPTDNEDGIRKCVFVRSITFEFFWKH